MSDTFTAEIRTSERSVSFVYFDAASTADGAKQLDHFLRARCIDPARVARAGFDFDGHGWVEDGVSFTCKHSIYDPAGVTQACGLPLGHAGAHAA